MSIIPFEDLFMPSRRPVYYQQRYTPDLMTSLLNDSFGQLQQLERQLGQAVQEDGNNYNFKCSVAGYRPEELSVDVQGEQLMIQGKHQQQDNDQSIHRTLSCHLDEQGRLQVQAVKKGVDKQQTKVNIPIGFKTSSDQQQQLTNGSQETDKKGNKQ
uniref:SHSP domain-containing protein n=1 Tax=Ditylenchus dipsaci TaxID=166011 RepID=A0A915D1K1_9BILA